jgi:hypothetical protein
MPRPKVKSSGLPNRVHFKGRKYWYVRPEDRKWIPLGEDLASMYVELGRVLQGRGSGQTMLEVMQEWAGDAREGLLSKSPKTQADWGRMLPRIRAFFGDAPPRCIKPHHVKEFMAYDGHEFAGGRRAMAPISANRHVEVFSCICSWAIQRGYLDTNPCLSVRRYSELHRTHLPTREEFVAARDRAGEYLGLLMDAAYITGARRGDLIRFVTSSLSDEGLSYVPRKTSGTDARARLLPWTEGLTWLMDEATKLRSDRVTEYLFVPPRASRWTEAGLNTAWQRLQTGFHFHDIRAMAASHRSSPQEAQALLAHAGETTTAIYRRGTIEVVPGERISRE